MAKIEIETLTENCWVQCEDFDVRITSMITGDNAIVYKAIRCEHVGRCRKIQQVIEDELRGGK